MTVRLKPADPAKFPNVVHVLSVFPRGTTVGSAALIGPRVLLTAGHVVYDPRLGNAARHFSIAIGGRPRRILYANLWQTTGRWIKKDSHLDDFGRAQSLADVGVIILDEPIDVVTPLFPVETTPREPLGAMRLNVAGYRAQTPPNPKRIYRASFVPTRLTKTRMYYPVRTIGGMSGAPIYQFISGQRTIRAIHTSHVNHFGNGLRITTAIFNLITQWLAEFHPSSNSAVVAA